MESGTLYWPYSYVKVARTYNARRKRFIMTTREFYTAIMNGTINDEITAKAAELLNGLSDRNLKAAAKRAEKVAAKNAERAPQITATVEFVLNATEPVTATDIASAMDFEVSPQLVHRFLKSAVEDGTIAQVTTKVKTEKGTHTVKAYTKG